MTDNHTPQPTDEDNRAAKRLDMRHRAIQRRPIDKPFAQHVKLINQSIQVIAQARREGAEAERFLANAEMIAKINLAAEVADSVAALFAQDSDAHAAAKLIAEKIRAANQS